MNNLKTAPVGIDSHINDFQTYLYNKLKTTWNVTDLEFEMFGRAYRNQTDDGYTPERYVGNKEYKDLYWDDKLKAMAFFGVKEDSQVNAGTLTSDCFLIFMVNLQQLKPANERKDEEIRNDVQRLCIAMKSGFIFSGFKTGIDSVFSEYSGWKKTIGMKFKDHYPLHCFRLDFKVTYSVYD